MVKVSRYIRNLLRIFAEYFFFLFPFAYLTIYLLYYSSPWWLFVWANAIIVKLDIVIPSSLYNMMALTFSITLSLLSPTGVSGFDVSHTFCDIWLHIRFQKIVWTGKNIWQTSRKQAQHPTKNVIKFNIHLRCRNNSVVL